MFATVENDVARFSVLNDRVAYVPLAHDLPTPSLTDVEQWRQFFGRGPTAMLAGQVRADKRPRLFLEACAAAGVTPVVVGPANDGEAELRSTAACLGIEMKRYDTYVPLPQFVAAMCAADVVVATHAIGSGSGPLALAQALGCRSVTVAVGGLPEQATEVAATDDSGHIAQAILTAIAQPRPRALDNREGLGEILLKAYGSAGWPP